MNLRGIFPTGNIESEAYSLIKFLINNSTDIILVIRNDNWIEFANPEACKKFEYSLDEFRYLRIHSVFPGFIEGSTESFEGFFLTKGGERFPAEVKSFCRHDTGKRIECLVIKSLFENSSSEGNLLMYLLLANYSTDMITRHNPDGTTTYASPSCERILGYVPEEIIGHTNFEFIYDDDIAIVQDVYPDILSKPVVNTSTYRVKHKDGRLIWVESTCQAVKAINGEIMEIYATTRDISERKRFEKELIQAKEKAIESDKLKTAFLQNMSHEIRTPINAIIGFSELLIEHLDNKEKLRYFSEIITKSSIDLMEIINDILDIARIESGMAKLKIETFSIKGLMEEIGNFFAPYQVKLKKEHVKFCLSFSPEIGDIILKTDHGKLKQIFVNLIGNAFKFTNQGEIEAGAYMENNRLIFYVSDTGVGISEDKHYSVFERFYQVYTPGSQTQGGTGLGLAIVKGLAELLGGEVWLKSQPGKGSSFYFSVNRGT